MSTDIIRRILRDYFKFNVKFQMNYTDVDDKIICKFTALSRSLDRIPTWKTSFDTENPIMTFGLSIFGKHVGGKLTSSSC